MRRLFDPGTAALVRESYETMRRTKCSKPRRPLRMSAFEFKYYAQTYVPLSFESYYNTYISSIGGWSDLLTLSGTAVLRQGGGDMPSPLAIRVPVPYTADGSKVLP